MCYSIGNQSSCLKWDTSTCIKLLKPNTNRINLFRNFCNLSTWMSRFESCTFSISAWKCFWGLNICTHCKIIEKNKRCFHSMLYKIAFRYVVCYRTSTKSIIEWHPMHCMCYSFLAPLISEVRLEIAVSVWLCVILLRNICWWHWLLNGEYGHKITVGPPSSLPCQLPSVSLSGWVGFRRLDLYLWVERTNFPC